MVLVFVWYLLRAFVLGYDMVKVITSQACTITKLLFQ